MRGVYHFIALDLDETDGVDLWSLFAVEGTIMLNDLLRKYAAFQAYLEIKEGGSGLTTTEGG